jgi:putative transposase
LNAFMRPRRDKPISDELIDDWLKRGRRPEDVDGLLKLISEESRPTADVAMEQTRAWQGRPLEAFYGIVSLDTLCVKIRQDGTVENQAVYMALGVGLDGRKDVLGLWISAEESAKVWFGVLVELRNRGVRDIYLIGVDGLRGFPPGIESIYPKARAQLCVTHMIRASLSYVRWPDRDKVIADLKPIYKAATAEEAERRRSQFETKWPQYPAVARLWREHWEQVLPFFTFPDEVRKVVSATNAMESLHLRLRKIAKAHDSFPSGEAAVKQLYLAMRKVTAKWEAVRYWKQMLNYLDTACGDRIREAGVRQH